MYSEHAMPTAISADLVKSLRDRTGAGFMECKAALTEANGDLEEATTLLREVNCESDFVARTDQFGALVKEIAMHVAAADPKYVRREEVPPQVLEKEKDIYRAQFLQSGKPANVIEKIVEGKLDAYYAQVVLLDQPFIRDPALKVSQIIAEATAKMGENITVSRFARFKIGESAD
jgi:elongation factor Ts